MKVGITGSPQSGKTTLFRLLTGMEPKESGSGSNIGVMDVPDPRVKVLSDIYKPKKTTYAKIDLVDVQPFKGQEFLNAVRTLDALIVVVGCFMDEPGVVESINFLENMETEFYLADLASVEGRLEKLKSNKAKPVNHMEMPFLEKTKAALDEETPLLDVDYLPHEKDFLTNFSFYTTKPIILAPNLSEKHLGSTWYPGIERIVQITEDRKYQAVEFSGVVEEQIESLGGGDKEDFLKAYSLSQPGTARVAQAAYSSLGLISFFTIGSDEVRAWTIGRNTKAKQAAGKIHTDLERGFIRADVVTFDDFKNLGSIQGCKNKGLSRLEGKNYVVQDGDIIDVRFNV